MLDMASSLRPTIAPCMSCEDASIKALQASRVRKMGSFASVVRTESHLAESMSASIVSAFFRASCNFANGASVGDCARARSQWAKAERPKRAPKDAITARREAIGVIKGGAGSLRANVIRGAFEVKVGPGRRDRLLVGGYIEGAKPGIMVGVDVIMNKEEIERVCKLLRQKRYSVEYSQLAVVPSRFVVNE